jgi:hypothetical protein
MPSFHLSFLAPAWIVLLCLLAGSGAAILFYRATLPPVSTGRRSVFMVLRGLSFTLLLLLVCEPVLRLTSTRHFPSRLAVLIDRSASMGIDDASGRRTESARHVLHDVLPGALPGDAAARYYAFDASLHGPEADPPDTLSSAADVTDIAQSLTDLLQRKESEPFQAALLISDGNVTLGDNPVHAAGLLGVPIVAIGIGDTSEHRDVVLARVAANDIVYAGTAVPLDGFLTEKGYDGAEVNVTMLEGNRLLASASVHLQPGGGETPVSLTYVPEGEGTHRYRVKVTPLGGEFTAANNERTVTVRVMKNHLRILLVAAGPGPDLVAFKQTLAEQRGMTVTVRTQRQGGIFYEGGVTADLLDTTDCIVTIGFPTSGTAPTVIQLLADAVLTRRIPLLFVAGPQMDPSRFGPLADVLPVVLRRGGHSSGEVECLPDEKQRVHPLITAGGEADPAIWRELPPVQWGDYTSSLREGSIQLMAPSMRTVPLPMPLIATRSIAGTRSVAFTAFELWHWRLMAQATPKTGDFFSALLRATVTWLCSPGDVRPVKVVTTRDSYPRGGRITFEAQIVDASAQPVGAADVHVEVAVRDQVVPVDLRARGAGQYTGSMEGLDEGVYRWKALATLSGSSLGSDSGSFGVGGMNLEFLETRLNAPLMRQIAYRSGGVYLAAGEAGNALTRVLDTLKTLTATNREEALTFELPHWPWMLALLVGLLGAEWILRKRSGML